MFLFTLGTFPLGFRRGYPTDLVAAADDLQADIQLEPSHRALRSKARVRNPPIVPYSIPFVGNLFAFAFDTAGFIASLSHVRTVSLGLFRKRFGDYIPCRVRVANQTIHIISGPEHINTLFKNSRDLTTKPSAVLVVENAFGAPAADHHILEADNTGFLQKPAEGSNPIKPHNRIF
ncbi:hypothetical protein LTR16_001447 [Cryomyces antarcticus]|uniref:Cytochrome P450 n=1 Tax=Cryomyces antarcticus TaxID=329879 RepID=A0ABR0M8H1_9PEZI|nr:hypothetical protein LTR60_001327 [Cryomyces antarcticus]KAK5019130.1 hypothetical protein LTR39_000571 [Cryomyces antarcticus]KAK5294139.1 hypothetical protein LTR16_001447 [Cryomyces antarcticus]